MPEKKPTSETPSGKKILKRSSEPPFVKKPTLFGLADSKDYGNIKPPILFLIRSNRKVELLEDVSPGSLVIKRTDGRECHLELSPERLLSFQWGNKESRLLGWVQYEEESLPYPTSVIHDSHILDSLLRKTILTLEKYERREAGMDKWKGIAYFIAVIVGVCVLAYIGISMFAPPPPAPIDPIPPKTIIDSASAMVPFILFSLKRRLVFK